MKTTSTIDIPAILAILKGGFTFSNILKIIALILGALAVPQLSESVPAAMSSTGATPNQLLESAAPILGAVAAWVASNFFKIKPEVVQAVIAWTINKENEDAGQRVDTACLLVLKSRHGDDPTVAADLARLAKSISAINFPDPVVVKKVV